MSRRSVRGGLAALAAMLAAAPTHGAPVGVRATATPAHVAVGDVFTYTVEITGVAELAESEVALDAGPFHALGPARVERGDAGTRVVQRLTCLSAACVPRDGERRLQVPAGRVRNRIVPPVEVIVRPRASEAAVRGGARAYVRETQLPAVEALVQPAAAARALAAAALAACVAASLLVIAGRPWLLMRRTTPLERAIRLLRESARRPSPDRRRAGDLLARVHPVSPLREDAIRFAWSEREPTAADAEMLAARAAEAAR